MAIRWDKFTVKAQEAVQRANELASEHGNPELCRCICWLRWSKIKKASLRRCWRKSASGRRPCSARSTAKLRSCRKFRAAAARSSPPCRRRSTSCWRSPSRRPTVQRRIRLDRAHAAGAARTEARPGAGDPGAARRDARCHSEGADRGARIAAHHRPESGSEVPGAGALRARPDRAGAARQARSR